MCARKIDFHSIQSLIYLHTSFGKCKRNHVCAMTYIHLASPHIDEQNVLNE